MQGFMWAARHPDGTKRFFYSPDDKHAFRTAAEWVYEHDGGYVIERYQRDIS